MLEDTSLREWIGRKRYPHAADFDQPVVIVPGISLADEKQQIAVGEPFEIKLAGGEFHLGQDAAAENDLVRLAA